MKNRLEGELISIAHRILKLKNKSEIAQLQKETLQLYEKLSILLFVEENYEDTYVEIPTNIGEKLRNTFSKKEKQASKSIQTGSVSEIKEREHNNISQDDIDLNRKKKTERFEDFEAELSNAKPKEKTSEAIQTENVSEMEKNDSNKLFQDNIDLDLAKNTQSFEDFEAQLSNAKPKKTPDIFDEKILAETPKTEEKSAEKPFEEDKNLENEKDIATENSLKTSKNDFDIRLNDRVAFEFHLFGSDVENFNRVLSQLTTFDTFEQAKDFIENVVKPDYNNWTNKKEYEDRLMEIIENRFL